MKAFSQRPPWVRLPATFALLTFLFGLLFAGILSTLAYLHEGSEIEKFAREHATTVADGLDYSFTLLEGRNGFPEIQRIVENAATSKWIKRVLIVRRDQTIVASSQRDLIGLPTTRDLRDKMMAREAELVMRTGKAAFDFDREGQEYGYVRPLLKLDAATLHLKNNGVVYVAVDAAFLRQNLERTVWITTAGILGVTIIGMVGIYFSMQRIVTRPLRRVVRAAKSLSKGDLGARTRLPADNEIGDLSRSFDQMADDLALERGALQSSEERYRTIFESVPVGVILVDRNGSVLDMNAVVLASLYGKRPASVDVQGKPVWELPYFTDPRLREALHRLSSGESFVLERVRLGEGQGIEVPVANIRGVPLQVQEGRQDVGLVSLEFVTERYRLEQQLLQAQKMESIGVLAGGVAHDFNNILVGILGYASLTKESTADPLIHEYVNVIEQSAMRAADLTHQLLAFARKGKYQVRLVEINELIGEIHHLIKESFDRSISIFLDLQTGLPLIDVDTGQIHQALLNICVNARDAMPEGGKLDISTRLAERYPRPVENGAESISRFVEIDIADTGCGMDAETQAKIFEPFFTTKPEGKGTGLGLAMVYGIVTGHGGFLDVESEPGRGTKFKVFLPVSDRKEEILRAPEISGSSGRGELILLADDEAVIRDLVETALSVHGYRVLVTGNGSEAIDLFISKAAEIRCIILDNVMPVMGGKQAVKELRKIDSSIPIILATGYGQEGEIQDLLRDARLEFLQKPFTVPVLLETIRRALEKGARRVA